MNLFSFEKIYRNKQNRHTQQDCVHIYFYFYFIFSNLQFSVGQAALATIICSEHPDIPGGRVCVCLPEGAQFGGVKRFEIAASPKRSILIHMCDPMHTNTTMSEPIDLLVCSTH